MLAWDGRGCLWVRTNGTVTAVSSFTCDADTESEFVELA